MGKPSDLCGLTAKQAVRLMHDGELRPEELTEAYLARIAEREPTVRAFACFDPGYARHRRPPPGPDPCTACPSASRTCWTPPTCQANTARPSGQAGGPRPTPPRSPGPARPAAW